MLLNYVHTLRSLNRNVLLYLAATALIGLSFDGGVFTVLFNLYLLRLDFGPEFIGQVASAGLLAFALASLPAGTIGERWGYRATMVIGLAMMIAGGLLVPLAEFLPARWTGPLILSLYVLMYAGLGLYFVNAVPFVMAISTDDERNQAFSMQTALLALAAFIGALGAGFLPRIFAALLSMEPQQPAPYRYPLLLASIMLIPSIGFLSRVRRTIPEPATETLAVVAEHAPSTNPITSSRWRFDSPILVILVLLSTVRFFQVSGVATASTFFNVYMDAELAVPTPQIGLITALARFIGIFAALTTPFFVARIGAPRTVLLASSISTLSMLPLALIPIWPAAGLGYIGVMGMSSMRFPSFMIFSMGLVPPSWRGTLAGIGEFSGGLSFAGLALLGGSMVEAQGFKPFFLLGGALTLVGTLLFYLWFILPREKRVPAPAS